MGKSNKRKSKRPSGSIKSRNIYSNNVGMPTIGPPRILKFPDEKNDAEAFAMYGLIFSLKGNHVPYFFDGANRYPSENGPDFEVQWNGRKAFLELTELAPLKGPYATAQRVFTVAEMASHLERLVENKNTLYSVREFKPLFLLIYVTDDAFYTSEEVLVVLCDTLSKRSDLIFEAIFFVQFHADGRPVMRMPYPPSIDTNKIDIEYLKQKQIINFDSREFDVLEEDPISKSIVIRQRLPLGSDVRKLVDSIKNEMPGLNDVIAKSID
ncbi:MAG: hypothetical protein LAT81_14525 [Oceanicaulis sp.]|nr:hypothetical protein [Oceanicaulis sp.]